jgi:hypothetical protein
METSFYNHRSDGAQCVEIDGNDILSRIAKCGKALVIGRSMKDNWLELSLRPEFRFVGSIEL